MLSLGTEDTIFTLTHSSSLHTSPVGGADHSELIRYLINPQGGELPHPSAVRKPPGTFRIVPGALWAGFPFVQPLPSRLTVPPP